MDKMTMWYVAFFLIACFFITLLALTQAFLRQQKIKNLMNELVDHHSRLHDVQQENQKLAATISTLSAKTEMNDVDQITQLMSWAMFIDRFNHRIKEAARYHLTMGILLLEIDDLTVINDVLGHEICNALLKGFADRVTASIRDVDFTARYNETTFAILLSQLASPETAVIVVQRILQSLKQPFSIKGHEVFVTATVGVSTYPEDGSSVETLLNCAHHALNLAKENGKSNYRFYQENMHAQSQRELILQTSLSKRAFNEDFLIYYQTVLNVQDHKIACMEVLPYWYHPLIGNMNADELYNYAEKCHKLEGLFEWLLKNACEEYMKWRSTDVYPDLIGIPITVAQLESSHLVYHISQILQNLKFNPEWLLLEINVGLRSLSFDVLEKSFNMLNYLKIKICITHFGQESLSLYFLKTIKTDFVKLDSSLISDSVNNPRTISLIESIIFLMKKMAIKLIATGVESAEQYNLLKQLGMQYMEGPYIGLPVTQEDVAKKITEYVM